MGKTIEKITGMVKRNAGWGVLTLCTAGVLYPIAKEMDSWFLGPEDFKDENVEWIGFYNQNGRIYSCYTNENIVPSRFNYKLYLDEVRKKNDYNLKGSIVLPDLDGDGKVGK